MVLGKLDVSPIEAQLECLYSPSRAVLYAGGERVGKSFISALYLVSRIPFGSLFWIVGPSYDLARPEFIYALEMLDKLGAIADKSSISVPALGRAKFETKSGQVIETKSADDVKKIAARAPDGIIMAEAAQQPYEAFLKCFGRVAERRGFLFCSGTFEGSEGWYPEVYYEWTDPENKSPDKGRVFSVPSWDNYHVYPGGRTDPEIQRLERLYSRVPGLFDERCGAVPVPPVGLVFREFRKSIHVDKKITYNPKLPVFLAIDPSAGGAPYAVVACQFVPCSAQCAKHHSSDAIDHCNIIDEIYEQGLIGEEVIALAMDRPWFKSVRGGAIDVEAPDEQKRWLRMAKVYLKADRVPQLQGIRREKSFLFYLHKEGSTTEFEAEPHLHISPKAVGIIHEYSKYKRRDPSDSDAIPKEEPPSNQPNHSIKALWYLLIARYGAIKGSSLPRVVRNWVSRSQL